MELDQLFDIFKLAIESESQAEEFYQKASQNTTDPESKTLFEEFAKMESYHLRRLKERYAELRETATS